MLRRLILVLLASAAPLAAAQDADLETLAAGSRKVADAYIGQIRGQLVKALEASGPIAAVTMCKYSVPEITSAVSRQTGWKVSRVSLKPRNRALATPDDWERKVLADFDARARRGEQPEAMEHFGIVGEGDARAFRYMKAIPVRGECLTCHGGAAQLAPSVKAVLARDYPHDQAVGYATRDVSGAVTIQRPLQR
jgi:hypothetical protein